MTEVKDVEAKVGGGMSHGGPHVIGYVIDFRSSMLCINIGYLGIESKMYFFGFCVEMSSFSACII